MRITTLFRYYWRLRLQGQARGNAEALNKRVWDALQEAAGRQAAMQPEEGPARRFLDRLGSALVAGHAHLTGPKGGAPDNPSAWGWRRGDGHGFATPEWRPQGGRVGWVDGEGGYLDKEAALAAANRLGHTVGGGVVVGGDTLGKRLHKGGYLVATERHHGDHTVRRTFGGSRRRVLHLHPDALSAPEAGEPMRLPLRP